MGDQPDSSESFRSSERVHRNRSGQTNRIEAVYRQQHEKLWRSLYAFTGNRELASEAASETVAQALGRGEQLRDPSAWIWKTAFKVASGLLASESSYRSLSDVESAWSQEPSEQDASLLEFLDLLDSLSPQQRAIVTLRYAGGFKPREIAEVLDTSPNTVRVQLHKAQIHLRERIDLR